MCCAVLCCAVLCCAVLCCTVLCCAVLWCMFCDVMLCAVCCVLCGVCCATKSNRRRLHACTLRSRAVLHTIAHRCGGRSALLRYCLLFLACFILCVSSVFPCLPLMIFLGFCCVVLLCCCAVVL